MNKSQRLAAIAVAGVLLLAGFAFGRISETPKTTAAEETKAAVNRLAETTSPNAASENQAFYLSDFKTGYSDGYNSGLRGETSSVVSTGREGYNEGFKRGYSDGYQLKAEQPAPAASRNLSATPVAYRSSAPVRRRSSKLKTALTIAAPAAIGAGVGAMVGGKKGAGVGALLGGGGGAMYHLIKNRN